MIATIVLSVVLGLVLLGAAAALLRDKRNFSSGRGRTAGPGTGRKALETVALGLRAVAEGRAHGPRPMPDVHAVVYSGRRLTLRLAHADPDAPSPWTADGSGKEWSVESASLRRTGNAGAGPTHPYSLTVTLGLHDGDRVLVDLAQLSGAIALTGDDIDVLRLAQALITELVSGPVGLLAHVVLVGSAATASVTEGLGVGARPARLHTAATRNEALTSGDAEPTGPVPAASASSFRTLHLSREGGVAASATHTRRLFVVTAAQFRDERWKDTLLRRTDALLVLGYIPDADWHFKVNADGSLDTGRLGVPIDTHTACLF
ncbi:hypothetical protein OG562_02860 [Streptomyces sp. NBC_01275]|uniref:hypothetical protein n=1 Tax=Streptomyces sp. NBC_01275 TaxID=2903807 RepID=UPI002252F2D6|nr:hypothetical protein [Streptomyces sp. NBC_01275]MCX4759950.1 hypothetical protein [Streptomyces sp. NBC_01275]